MTHAPTITEVHQFLPGSLQLTCSPLGVEVDFLSAVIPQQTVALLAGHLLRTDRQAIHRLLEHFPFGDDLFGHDIQFVPANRIGLLQQPSAELLIFFATARQHRDKAALLTRDVIHVFTGRQLAIGHIQEIGMPH